MVILMTMMRRATLKACKGWEDCVGVERGWTRVS